MPADAVDKIKCHEVAVVGDGARAPLKFKLLQAVPVVEEGSLGFVHSAASFIFSKGFDC